MFSAIDLYMEHIQPEDILDIIEPEPFPPKQPDRRAVTSKRNAAKATAARKRKKETTYDIYEDEGEDEDDDYEDEPQPRKRKGGRRDPRLDELYRDMEYSKTLIEQLYAAQLSVGSTRDAGLS